MLRLVLALVGVALLALAGADAYVLLGPHARIATRLGDVAPAPYGLVLGTGRISGGGLVNPAYAARMDAAAALFHAGKVERLIASGYREFGGRATGDYDELADMREDLAARGVPDAAIILDDGARRTMASVLRARCFAGDASVIIVSQRAHVARALFLASVAGRHDVGFAAAEPPEPAATGSARWEILARLLALRDAADILLGLAPAPACEAPPG